MKWFTCLNCGARWERVWDSQVEPANDQKEETVEKKTPPREEPATLNRSRAKGLSALKAAPQDPTASGSARQVPATESPKTNPVELPTIEEEPAITMEDQMMSNYRDLVKRYHMEHRDALEFMYRQAQNELERGAIKDFAGTL